VLLLGVDTSSTSYHVGEIAGLAIVVGLAIAVVRRALTRGFGRPSPGRRRAPRNLAIAILAVLLALGYLASSVDRGLLDGTSGGPWSTSEGVNLKAGFIAGCGHGVPSRSAVCGCVFARIASSPPYDTPSGFETLTVSLRRFQQTRDLSRLPAPVLGAVRGCAG
jgi:hypothetical protein